MAIDLATGFNIGSKDAIDERQILTLEQMKNLDESIYPDKYFAICKDNGKLYLYNVNNIVDSETGKFRVLEGNTVGDGTTDSAHKTVIFENNIDMGRYLLLAKITNANYANNIIKFSCPDFKGQNDAGFRYEDDMDILKFELHFNTGSMRENNGYGVTLKQHGLVLYSYPLNNPQNTSPEIKEAVRLYWDYSKGEIYVFLVDLMTAIPHCVLEYTGSGTLLRENTFVNDDLYNRMDGANGAWEESKWKSIPYNKLETPPIYELGGESGSVGGTTTYTSLDALNLTADATVEDVVNTLKNGESFLAPVNTFTNYETIFPNKVPNDQWNKIHIIKGTSLASSHIRCFSQSGACEYLANVNNTNIVCWNDVSGTYNDISDNIIEKLGTEILKYPIGKYRINSATTGNKFTDLPSDVEMKCGLIEVNGTAVGKSPFTDAWVYRMYKFECLTGTLSYIRRLNSGATAGQIELDTGWCKEGQSIYTSLSQLGLTSPITVGEIFNAMPNKTMAILSCEDIADHITDVPTSYGVLTIKKNGRDRFSIDYQNSLQSSPCNVKRWIGTLKGENGTGLYWRLISTQTTYTALSDMELTASANVQDVINALPIGCTALLRTDAFTNWSTLFNGIQYGYLKVEKTVNGLSNIELQEVTTPNRRYFGAQSGGNFYKWQQVASATTDVLDNDSNFNQIPNANLVAREIHGKFINIADYSDALAMPNGKWRVDSNNKANQMQNLPVPRAGILEVKYLHGNDGTTAYTGTYKYAMLTYTAVDGNIYKRSFNSDSTVGIIVNDTGWQKIGVNDTRVTTLETQVSELFQSVSDGKTLVANAITGKGVSTSTTATFATMATNIGKISGGYKEETKTLIVTSNSTGTEVLTFTFSANVIAVKQIVAPSYDGSQGTCYVVTSTSKNIFSINGKEVTFYVRGTGRWEATAIVQA